MIVTRDTCADICAKLAENRVFSVDVESTGLKPYHGDQFFSVIVADARDAYYFNFNLDAEDFPEEERLGASELNDLAALLECSRFRIIYGHNIRFDLAMLANRGIRVSGIVWDTQVGARLEYNDHMSYSLDACAERIGLAKSDVVMAYLKEKKLYTKEDGETRYHFDRVPKHLIVPYAEMDARITFELGMRQRQTFRELDKNRPLTATPIKRVLNTELRLTRTLFHVERQGVPVDRAFCERAIVDRARKQDEARGRFRELTGRDYMPSGKLFAEVFAGVRVPTTEKGNPCYDADTMEMLAAAGHTAASAVLEIKAAKSDQDFFGGFLHHADEAGAIHSTLNAAGTKTGRFSSSSPNLQNLTKVEGDDLKAEFVVRRAIVPPPGLCFVMMDMDQAEYRLMLDYAGARGLIDKVLSGLDVHQATADVAGITRKVAKTANFATLYGAGMQTLAASLGVPLSRAYEIRDAIFQAAPEIPAFLRLVTTTAERRGYVVNWHGRRCHFPNPRGAYKAPNALIQGGIADVVKVGMNRVHRLLKPTKSALVLNIHDELVFQFHPDDFCMIPLIKAELEAIYPHRYLPLTWGVDHSWKSLADKVEGLPK